MQATLKKERVWYIILLCIVTVGVYQSVKPQPKLEVRLEKEAQDKIKTKQFSEAVELFEKIVSYTPSTEIGLKASDQGGYIAFYETKEYQKALFFYRNTVRHGQEKAKIKNAQEKIAEIFYEKLSDYKQAILEFNRLLLLAETDEEKQKIQQKIAKTYFYEGNFEQAALEVDDFLSKWDQSNKNFEMLSLKANAQTAAKKYDEAIKTFDTILKDFAFNEGIEEIYLNKAQCFEEKKEWDKAIQILKDIKDKYSHPEVIEMRIKSILRRKEKRKM